MTEFKYFTAVVIANILLLVSCSSKQIAVSEIPKPIDKIKFNEEIVFIPSKRKPIYRFETTIFKPAKYSDHSPIIIINHGTNPEGREKRNHSENPVKFFLEKGAIVILPMRQGYSESSGVRVHLKKCDMYDYSMRNANDIDEVILWIKAQAQYKDRKIALIGQSTGGLAAMAYSSFGTNPADAIINFHGGMRSKDSDDCKWQARIDAFTKFAKTSKPMSLWIYSANDHSSNPAYINKLYKEFSNAGGMARLFQIESFKQDGHYVFSDLDGGILWQPKVEDYLQTMGVTF